MYGLNRKHLIKNVRFTLMHLRMRIFRVFVMKRNFINAPKVTVVRINENESFLTQARCAVEQVESGISSNNFIKA